MKILKKIAIGFVVLIVLLLVVAIFIPTTYTVSISTTIDKPQQEVYDYVKQIKNQEYYSVWVMQDTNIVIKYTGTDGTVGFISSWESKEMGVGEQQITKLDGERVDVDLRFKEPMESEAKAATIVKAAGDTKSTVTTEFYGHNAYPTNLMCFIGKKFIKDAQTQDLANLKAILEKK